MGEVWEEQWSWSVAVISPTEGWGPVGGALVKSKTAETAGAGIVKLER